MSMRQGFVSSETVFFVSFGGGLGVWGYGCLGFGFGFGVVASAERPGLRSRHRG